MIFNLLLLMLQVFTATDTPSWPSIIEHNIHLLEKCSNEYDKLKVNVFISIEKDFDKNANMFINIIHCENLNEQFLKAKLKTIIPEMFRRIIDEFKNNEKMRENRKTYD